jgi:hypothetical protein
VAYTEFYTDASTGSNINAGDLTANGVVTSTNGGWSTVTNIFTAASGTPFSGVSVGDFASVYTDGATVTGYIGRVTAVGGSGATLTISSTAKSGSAPTTAGTGISCTTGGAWKGPNGASIFPFAFITNAMTNSTGNEPCVNMKSGTEYVITASIAHSFAGNVSFYGYTTTVRDGGRAIINGSTSTTYYNVLNITGVDNHLFNFEIKNNGNSGTQATGVILSGAGIYAKGLVVHDVRGTGINLSGGAFIDSCETYSCNQSNTANLAGIVVNSSSLAQNCISHDNSGSNNNGFATGSGSNTRSDFHNCIADSNGLHGFFIVGRDATFVSNCDSYNNGADGIRVAANAVPQNVIIANTNLVKHPSGWGINVTDASGVLITNCGFGTGTQANASGNISAGVSTQSTGSVTYASDVTPWVDPANGDFRINLAAAKNAGAGVFTETAASYAGTIGYPDIGAAQHQDSGSGGGLLRHPGYGGGVQG